MKKTRSIYQTDKAPQPIGPYSQAVKAGQTLYISGQIGLNPDTGQLEDQTLETETRQMMANVKAILNEADMTLEHIVKCTIYLAEMDTFPAINALYGQYFGEQPPAREAIAVKELPKGAHVEIAVIAVE